MKTWVALSFGCVVKRYNSGSKIEIPCVIFGEAVKICATGTAVIYFYFIPKTVVNVVFSDIDFLGLQSLVNFQS